MAVVVVVAVLAVSGYLVYSSGLNSFIKSAQTKISVVAGGVAANTNTTTTAGSATGNKSVDPTLTLISPVKGATISDGDKITVNTNESDSNYQVLVSVSSDKWGSVYSNIGTGKTLYSFDYSPNQTVPAGSSGSVDVKLLKGGKTLLEQTVWVNF